MLTGMALAVIRPGAAHASSATVELLSERDKYNVGETIAVELKLSADTVPGKLTAYLTYDYKILKFDSKDAADYVSGGDGVLTISDSGDGENSAVRSYAVRFTARRAGTCELTLKDTSTVTDSSDGHVMPMAVAGITITVTDPAAEAAGSEAEAAAENPADHLGYSGTETSSAGATAGAQTGATAGASTGATAGATAESQTGAASGAEKGSTAGAPAGALTDGGTGEALSADGSLNVRDAVKDINFEAVKLVEQYRQDVSELTVIIVILLVICTALLLVTIKLVIDRRRGR